MFKNITVDQNRLVAELHIAIQEIYYRDIFKFMNSCLHEVLNTALGRFSELKICVSNAFSSQMSIGTQFIYL